MYIQFSTENEKKERKGRILRDAEIFFALLAVIISYNILTVIKIKRFEEKHITTH